MATDPYSIYLRAFAKVASGAKIADTDFLDGDLPEIMDSQGQAAVAMATQDVAKDYSLKSKAELTAELGRLFGQG